MPMLNIHDLIPLCHISVIVCVYIGYDSCCRTVIAREDCTIFKYLCKLCSQFINRGLEPLFALHALICAHYMYINSRHACTCRY